jgi:hypothetical protein
MPFPHWEEDMLRNQARLWKLQTFVQFSSRWPMQCEDDVLQYYKQFLALSKSMTLARYLSSDKRDTAFWCGFHLDDRRVLQPHSLDTPRHFEDVFMSAWSAFSYKPKPMYMPLPMPTSPPQFFSSKPSLLPAAPHSHPSPKRPPKICRPASTPPIAQRFNDLGERNLPSPSPASPAQTTPSPASPPPSPMLPLLSCLPALSSSLPDLLPVPSPFPQSPAHSLSLPCDSLLVLLVTSLLPVLTMFSSPCSHFDNQSLVPTPLPFPQSSNHLLLPPHSLSRTPPALPALTVLTTSSPPLLPSDSHAPSLPIPSPLPVFPTCPVPTCLLPLPPNPLPMLSPSPLLIHPAATSPSPPSLPLASLLQLLDSSRSSSNLPPPLLPRPPNPTPASSVESQLPPLPPMLKNASSPSPSVVVPLHPHPSPCLDLPSMPSKSQSLLLHAHATSSPPAPSHSLTSPLWPLDCVPTACRDIPPPLTFPPLPLAQPPDLIPASSEPPPPSTPSPSPPWLILATASPSPLSLPLTSPLLRSVGRSVRRGRWWGLP